VKRTVLVSTVALAAASLAGCPSHPGPTELWLAPDNSEVILKLVDHEPPPW